MSKIKLGIAPLTWTNDDLPELGKENTFEQCVSEMALAGYQGCEIGNKFPRDLAVLKDELSMRGLQVCNAWFSFYFTTKPFADVKQDFIKHASFLQALGAGSLVELSKAIVVKEIGMLGFLVVRVLLIANSGRKFAKVSPSWEK